MEESVSKRKGVAICKAVIEKNNSRNKLNQHKGQSKMVNVET